MQRLHLVSHHLCPYVQRAVITLTEKDAPHERTYVELSDKPDWFKALSPLGKVPLLAVGDQENREVLFESAVICDYLDEAIPPRLHPEHPLERAQHRGWIEFASATLNDIWGLYSAPDEAAFARKRGELATRFGWVERTLSADGPYFAGARFSLVDAAWGPVFRYFDVFDAITDLGVFAEAPSVRKWRAALARRPSVRDAVAPDYPERLYGFLKARNSYLSGLMA